MSNDINTRAPFFPNSKGADQARRARSAEFLKRNSAQRAQQLQKTTARDAKVEIPESVRDYSRIRGSVDAAPQMDNTDKIADLKARINSGKYDVDYDAIADKMLSSEF
jgi:negative regulator of flagellin synthesis FlgM